MIKRTSLLPLIVLTGLGILSALGINNFLNDFNTPLNGPESHSAQILIPMTKNYKLMLYVWQNPQAEGVVVGNIESNGSNASSTGLAFSREGNKGFEFKPFSVSTPERR